MARVTYAAAVLACGVLAIGCGGGVEGEYVGKKGESFFDSLTFRSDGKVEVVMIGVRHEGTFEADGGQVTITAPNGERTPLMIPKWPEAIHQIVTGSASAEDRR